MILCSHVLRSILGSFNPALISNSVGFENICIKISERYNIVKRNERRFGMALNAARKYGHGFCGLDVSLLLALDFCHLWFQS
jgi:hypothetical protein